MRPPQLYLSRRQHYMTPIDLKVRTSGRYKFRIVNKFTGKERRVDAKADNLLLVSFFQHAVSNRDSNQGYLASMVVGSGTTPPSVSDTGLANFVAGTAISQGPALPKVVNATVYPRYVTRHLVKRFNGTSIAGVPLSEVGLAITTSASQTPNASTPLASRALITDSAGNPTSITVLADEFLDVTYELTTYAMDGVTGSFDINIEGVVETFNYEIRPESMNSTSAWSSSTTSSGNTYLSAKSYPGASNVDAYSSYVSAADTFTDPVTNATPPDWNLSNSRFTSYKQLPIWDGGAMSATGILTLPLNNGNYPGGFNSIVLNFGFSSPVGNMVLGVHRMLLDKPVPKTSDHVFDFPVTLSLANTTPPGV